jgi:sodium transport system permease protein
MRASWVVFRKELTDALRDHRTLLTVSLTSIAVGPVLLLALSTLIAGLERRAEERQVLVAGIEQAPTLRNYLERQTFVIEPAPADYETRIRDGSLTGPVLVVAADFEADLARGVPPALGIVSSSTNQGAQASASRVGRLLRGFTSEQATLRLAYRGVAPAVLEVVDVQERDLASAGARAAQFTGMVPFFVLMAVLYGALHAALDTTAGERERGSLEPLLMNPTSRDALVIGKWGAVAAMAMLVAVLSCLSFLPGQWLMRSESLAAMFQFGLRETAMFLVLLLPLSAALSAILMAVAIRCRSFKEAQANNTVVILAVSLAPMVTVFNPSGDVRWHLWVPALGQMTLMSRVLRGEALGAVDVAIPFVVCMAVAMAGITYVARHLQQAALR